MIQGREMTSNLSAKKVSDSDSNDIGFVAHLAEYLHRHLQRQRELPAILARFGSGFRRGRLSFSFTFLWTCAPPNDCIVDRVRLLPTKDMK